MPGPKYLEICPQFILRTILNKFILTDIGEKALKSIQIGDVVKICHFCRKDSAEKRKELEEQVKNIFYSYGLDFVEDGFWVSGRGSRMEYMFFQKTSEYNNQKNIKESSRLLDFLFERY